MQDLGGEEATAEATNAGLLARSVRRVLLRNFQCPGDIVMLTAVARDLSAAAPGKFQIYVETSCEQLWDFNPYVHRHAPQDAVDYDNIIDCEYPLIENSNGSPYHFIHGFTQFLEAKLGIRIPVTQFRGDIHIGEIEKCWMSQVAELGITDDFWIMMAGGKYDFTTKWWNPEAYERVVDHFAGKITFVQCGSASDWHPPLRNAIDFIGKTDLRQFVRLIYHSLGVVCPVTFAMHAAAAVPTRPDHPPSRACVVIAGGREPPHWEAYPNHRFLSNTGSLRCCASGGCWKSRCQPVADGDLKDFADRCEQPVSLSQELSIPRCMDMIRADDVIRAIESYYEGDLRHYNTADLREGIVREP